MSKKKTKSALDRLVESRVNNPASSMMNAVSASFDPQLKPLIKAAEREGLELSIGLLAMIDEMDRRNLRKQAKAMKRWKGSPPKEARRAFRSQVKTWEAMRRRAAR